MRASPLGPLLMLATWLAVIGQFAVTSLAAPIKRPYSSDAHRAGSSGAYGGLKSRNPTVRAPNDTRDANKQPYYYRYYNDTDRSPGSCRRFAQRAIATKNRNWWTRYRACLK
jgi:hypothetical protein